MDLNFKNKFYPYKPCKGRIKEIEKLKKPLCILKNSKICNSSLLEKNKIKFLNQLFKWYKKDFEFYKVDYFLKDIKNISDCDILYLSVKIQKAGWKKLLLNLNYHLTDYKKLKRRSYSLNFIFFFINIKDNLNKDTTVDIQANNFDKFNIFITTNSLYSEDFYNIINIWEKKKEEDAKKDEIDFLFDEVKKLYSFNKENFIFGYEYYFSWFLTREDYFLKLKKKVKKNLVLL